MIAAFVPTTFAVAPANVALFAPTAAIVYRNDEVVETNDAIVETTAAIVYRNDEVVETNDAIVETNAAIVYRNDEVVETNDEIAGESDAIFETMAALVDANDEIAGTNGELVDTIAAFADGSDEVAEPSDEVTETMGAQRFFFAVFAFVAAPPFPLAFDLAAFASFECAATSIATYSFTGVALTTRPMTSSGRSSRARKRMHDLPMSTFLPFARNPASSSRRSPGLAYALQR
jgi:hypothetical protein